MIIIDCTRNFTFLLFVGLATEAEVLLCCDPQVQEVYLQIYLFSLSFLNVLFLGRPMTKAAAPGLSGSHPRFPGV